MGSTPGMLHKLGWQVSAGTTAGTLARVVTLISEHDRAGQTKDTRESIWVKAVISNKGGSQEELRLHLAEFPGGKQGHLGTGSQLGGYLWACPQGQSTLPSYLH